MHASMSIWDWHIMDQVCLGVCLVRKSADEAGCKGEDSAFMNETVDYLFYFPREVACSWF